MADQVGPVFIHSLFRTGSTYFWNKFREKGKYYCYYEPFHQDLIKLTSDNPAIWAYDNISTKKMKHPDLSRHHFYEYEKVIRGDPGDVPCFKKSFSFDEFCHNGDNPDLKKYINTLIKNSGKRVPVLQFNRSSLRINWFRENYPGSVNIYLVRNPRDQWKSYNTLQKRLNLKIFLLMDLICVSKNQNKIEFKYLKNLLNLEKFDSEDFEVESNFYSEKLNSYTKSERYLYFYYLWLASLISGIGESDLFINMDLLSTDSNYRESICEKLISFGLEGFNFRDANIKKYDKHELKSETLDKIEKKVQEVLLTDKRLRSSVFNRKRIGKREILTLGLINSYLGKLIKLKKKRTKRIAFIDHSFHTKSKATDFLVNILRENFRVEVFLDRSWEKGPWVDLKKLLNRDFDIFIFFQIIHYPREEINLLRNKTVIVFPMYDASLGLKADFWEKFRFVKFVNFSVTLHKYLTDSGFDSLYTKYFPKPDDVHEAKNSDGLKAFFWQRTDKITWIQIKKLVERSSIKKFHIHSAVDPLGFKYIAPSKEDKERFNMTFSKWFKKSEDYIKLLRESDIYFAPRENEGIGMSLLEAMAMGKLVVAPNNPTMNEYITDGENGILYDPQNIKPVSFVNIDKMREKTVEYMKSGYFQWDYEKDLLSDYILNSSDKSAILYGSFFFAHLSRLVILMKKLSANAGFLRLNGIKKRRKKV